MQSDKFNYSKFVSSKVKDANEIKEQLTPFDCHILHMSMGLSGEVGELIDALKKAVIYRRDIDLQNIVEELGDIEFYLEGLRMVLGYSREKIIQINIDKLEKRYNEGKYSDKQATERADKESK